MAQAMCNSGQAGPQAIYPAVPPRFAGRLPPGVNDVNGWAFRQPEVEEAAKGNRLLTLDIDMDGKGTCSLKCGHCFRRGSGFSKEKRMGREELFVHLAEAKALGLRSVKLIGPGEPLEEADLLNFIRRLKGMGITVLIFTKGHVLGNDALCRSIHGMDGRALAAELRKLDVSMLLGTTSFVPELEDSTVGRFGYHAERNEAILRLMDAGFADFKPGEATRLAFVCTPVSPKNIEEVFDLYVWARERNIQPVIAPTMIARLSRSKLSKIVPEQEALLRLYARILVWAVEHGVMSREDLEKYGVPAYAGGAWCNQVAVGMYLMGDGTVLECPGGYHVLGSLKEQRLTEIWNRRKNRQHAGQFNNGCPPKEGKSFPARFFEDVLDRVREFFATPP